MDPSIQEKITKWVTVDNRLAILNEQVKQLKELRQTLSKDIIARSELHNSFIPIQDGKLRIVNNKTAQSITFTYLENCLKEIIRNENQVDRIVQYIKNKRIIKNNFEIKRFYND
jgi:hypothetical protein